MTSLSPAFYLSQLERKRGRDQALEQGLGDATKGALGGLDMLSKLQASMKSEADAKEAKDYGRSINDRNQKRADAKAALEEELTRSKVEAAKGSKPSALETINNPVMQKYLHSDDGASDADPDAPPSENAPAMNDAFNMVRDSLEGGDATIMTPQAQKAIEDARRAKALADIAERKASAPPTQKDPVDREIKEARADSLRTRTSLAKDKLAHLDPNRPVGHPLSEGTVAKLAVDKSIVSEINALADDASDKAFGIEGAALDKMPDSAKTPERRAFESRIHQMALHIASAYKSSVTDAEIKILEHNLMHASDSREGFQAIARQEARQLANRIKMREGALHEAGYGFGAQGKAIEKMSPEELKGLSDEDLKAIAGGG